MIIRISEVVCWPVLFESSCKKGALPDKTNWMVLNGEKINSSSLVVRDLNIDLSPQNSPENLK